MDKNKVYTKRHHEILCGVANWISAPWAGNFRFGLPEYREIYTNESKKLIGRTIKEIIRKRNNLESFLNKNVNMEWTNFQKKIKVISALNDCVWVLERY